MMTDRGEYIAIEVAEVTRDLPTLLDAVERGGRIIHILRNGETVAELRPPASVPPDPLARHPEIADVVIAPDAFAPADEQDWPSECR